MLIVLVLVLGLAFGSFINALVWRLHLQFEAEKAPKSAKKSKKTTTKRKSSDLSILNGRSVCVHCGHQLAPRDLVPVFSWLALRGKCRYCGEPISSQYPLVEVLTASSFIISYLNWPYDFDERGIVLFVAWLIALVGLIALLVYDLHWLILPNKIIYPLIVLYLGVTAVDAAFLDGTTYPIRDAVFGLLIGGGLFYLLFVISDGRWIGGGDVKLGILIGLLLGPARTLLAIFIASLIGSLFTLSLLATGRITRKTPIPFGPYLIVATFVALLWGQRLIDWYNDQFLYGLL